MARLSMLHTIQSSKAKTVEQALAVVQQLRKMNISAGEELELDFSGISRTTSMFVDRLVRALATFYGNAYPRMLHLSGAEEADPMLPLLWEAAIDKFRHAHNSFAEA